MRVVIVDDEFPARRLIRHYLKGAAGIEVSGEFDNGNDALEMLKHELVDLVFLDIRMLSMNGIDVAEKINQMSDPPMIVFTTGFTEFAVKAFEVNAVDYLVKPYTQERIFEALERARGQQSKKIYERLASEADYSHGKLPVWKGDRLSILRFADIHFFNAFKRGQTLVHTQKGAFVSNRSLKDLEAILTTGSFLRVHKSYIVNLEHIEEIVPSYNNTYELTIANSSDPVPVSRNYMQEFRKVLNISKS